MLHILPPRWSKGQITFQGERGAWLVHNGRQNDGCVETSNLEFALKCVVSGTEPITAGFVGRGEIGYDLLITWTPKGAAHLLSFYSGQVREWKGKELAADHRDGGGGRSSPSHHTPLPSCISQKSLFATQWDSWRPLPVPPLT